MSIDDVAQDFAPYHVVSVGGSITSGCGRFTKLQHAFDTARFLSVMFPEGKYVVLDDHGVIQEHPAETELRKLKATAR